jgi:hypothetical protein
MSPEDEEKLRALGDRVRARAEQRGEPVSHMIFIDEELSPTTTQPVRNLLEMVDEAWAASRAARAEAPQAAQEARCVSPPMGCGQLTGGFFKNDTSRAEYGITGLCQRCQDALFVPPPDMSPEDIADLERDEDWFRCFECGEWREMTEVDVGVYDSKGRSARYEVCCPTWEDSYVRLPRCTEVPDCQIGEGHVHGHVAVDLHKHRCFRCGGYFPRRDPGQPRLCACQEYR